MTSEAPPSHEPDLSQNPSPTSDSVQILRALFLLFFVVVLGALTFMGRDYYDYVTQSEPERISYLWQKDLLNLDQYQVLPREFFQLGSFKIISTSKLTESWKTQLQVPFSTQKDGPYHMEILLLDLEEKEHRGAVIQMNITRKKDNNHVWELGRTYTLKPTAWEKKILMALQGDFKNIIKKEPADTGSNKKQNTDSESHSQQSGGRTK